MKLKFTSCIVFIFCLVFSTSIAQVNVYTEYQLPKPNQLSPLFFASITEGGIYYGNDANTNSNKPVVVFVHGFVDLANAWFAPGNDMYDRFYNRGYRTAFVATTRGQGMWYNGEMLSYMLDDITTHYGVNDVVIVAHSNGGKASEVAMFPFGKYNKVDRVITLGTPFKGTGLADLGELPGFAWLMDLIGLGGGTSTSTTYYMEGVARPILDNHPDNQPSKFINFGAWGYAHGNTIAAPAMFTGGSLLNVMGGGPFNGGNDGVTPYYSSTRPGGSQKWPGHCWTWWCNKQSKHDHIDITFDDVVFNHIEPWISNPLRVGEEVVEEINRSQMLESNFEILSPKSIGTSTFEVGENVGQVTVTLVHKNDNESFSILDANNQKVESINMLERGLGVSSNSTFVLENPAKGTYTVDADTDEYVAFVSYENAPILLFDNSKLNYEKGESITLKAQMDGTDMPTTIKGMVTLKNDLNGHPVNNETFEIEFNHTGNMNYEYHLPQLSEGVYTLMLNANSKEFNRTIVSGFVIQKRTQIEDVAENELSISNYPNPVNDVTTLTFEKEEEGNARLNLLDNFGRVVKAQDISELPLGEHQLEWEMNNIHSGTYFLEFQNGDKKVVKQIVVLKR